MSKRSLSVSLSPPIKKQRQLSSFRPIKIATKEAADAVHTNRHLISLLSIVQASNDPSDKGACVVYWMRMSDLRVSDNRALFQASQQAERDKIPLVVIFVLSPQDYVAHDRSARRIDFTLRNLTEIRSSLSILHIPLHVTTHTPRRTLPEHILQTLRFLGATRIFGNIEYELDELRRDIRVCDLAQQSQVKPVFVHDKCIVDPGVCVTKQGKPYTVYTPFQRTWLAKLNANLLYYLDNSPPPEANEPHIRVHATLGSLFDTNIPSSVPGFELEDDDRILMNELWPAGEDSACNMLDQFLKSARSLPMNPPFAKHKTTNKHTPQKTRILAYNDDRDNADPETTSRLSPYLSAGIISARGCIRAVMALHSKNAKVDASRDTGPGRWIQELAWRDFYTNILVEFPRVGMGRPFQEKFAAVKWVDVSESERETVDSPHSEKEGVLMLRAWKEGRTGVPIVDAGMRQLKSAGWMHNRLRMICAMFLCKDLMIDWRLGERHFMQMLIDGDLASNNGGWQWCASTGTDATPYFRIMNPYSQSEKVDARGEVVRKWVPELAGVKDITDVHNPPAALADKLGYPHPIVKHAEVRDRAIRRYKDPGVE